MQKPARRNRVIYEREGVDAWPRLRRVHYIMPIMWAVQDGLTFQRAVGNHHPIIIVNHVELRRNIKDWKVIDPLRLEKSLPVTSLKPNNRKTIPILVTPKANHSLSNHIRVKRSSVKRRQPSHHDTLRKKKIPRHNRPTQSRH